MFYESMNSYINEKFDFLTVGAMDYPEHFHRNLELFTAVNGSYDVNVEDREYTLEPGDAVLILPYQKHSYPPPLCNNMEGKLLIFSPEFVPFFMRRYQGKLPLTNKFVCNVKTDTCLGDDIMLKISFLYNTLSDFARQTEFTDKSADNNDLLRESIVFANENFRNECSLSDLAKHLNYSYSYVSKHFSKNMSISFKQYVSLLRLNCAHDRLTLGDVTSIANLAFECGFTSISTFNREFKRQFGCAPSTLLRQMKNSNRC